MNRLLVEEDIHIVLMTSTQAWEKEVVVMPQMLGTQVLCSKGDFLVVSNSVVAKHCIQDANEAGVPKNREKGEKHLILIYSFKALK